MKTVSFTDNLYGGPQLQHLGGCGLQGFVRHAAGLNLERHAPDCKPGMWLVSTFPHDRCEDGWACIFKSVDAVMDDFGSLIKVAA